MKALYIIIAIELALSITLITLRALTSELRLHPFELDFFHAFQLISQIIFIIAGGPLPGYLLYCVRKNSIKFNRKIKTGIEVIPKT